MSTKQLLNQFRGLFTFSKLWLLQTSKEGNLPTLGPMPAAPLPCERTAGSHSFLLGPQGLDAFTCGCTCHDVKMKLSRLKCVSSLCSGHATVLNRWSRNRKLSQIQKKKLSLGNFSNSGSKFPNSFVPENNELEKKTNSEAQRFSRSPMSRSKLIFF